MKARGRHIMSKRSLSIGACSIMLTLAVLGHVCPGGRISYITSFLTESFVASSGTICFYSGFVPILLERIF